MASYQHDLFKKLIEKLQLTTLSAQKALQDGLLTELVIHDRSNLWSFQITLASIMPYKIFQDFMQRLHNVFAGSSLKVTFHIDQPKVTDSLIKDYWLWVVNNCHLSSILKQQLAKNSQLKVTNGQVSLDTKERSLRSFLMDGALVDLEDTYHQLGFPNFKIHVAGVSSKRNLPTQVVDFPIKKTKSDVKLAREAVKALDNDEKPK